jgi:hypothetical protein
LRHEKPRLTILIAPPYPAAFWREQAAIVNR